MQARAFPIGFEGMELEKIKDRYTFIKKLGSGATAEVNLAWDSLLDRKVAVKSGEGKELLLQEARYLTMFQARFFPVLYEYREEAGRSFLMMEYIQGENLKERFHRIGQYTEEEVFRIARSTAEALDYLHTGEEACIYGDIKAENIMVQPDGVVRLVDFPFRDIWSEEVWKSVRNREKRSGAGAGRLFMRRRSSGRAGRTEEVTSMRWES